jgi:outer membrane protein OmpA-like peptidoglycan-associated protein
MKRLAASCFSFVFTLFFLMAQEAAEETYKSIFLDGEFFLYQEEYVDALSLYQRLYNRGYETNANINYRMGICYLNIPGQKDKAIGYLETAVKKIDPDYKEGVLKQDIAPPDAYIFLGNAYRINNRLDDAIKAYGKYKSNLTEKQVLEKQYANKQIEACRNAKEIMKNPIRVEFVNAGENINSATSNYNPVLSADGNTLLYMNELPFYDAVYHSTKTNGVWGMPVNITPQIQSDGDLITKSLSSDGKTLILTKEGNFNSDIWTSTLGDDGIWTPAQPFSKKINTKYWESHASLSPDGQTLYFASNMKGGMGEMDIFMSSFDPIKNEWGDPVNLGKTINTHLNEDAPVITPDGNTLFFSSQGHYCMGGYDIFYSKKDPKTGKWGKPVNMGYPLNTTDDEIFYWPITNDGMHGAFARLRDDGFGREDVYWVNIAPAEMEEPIVSEIPEPVDEPEPVQTGPGPEPAAPIVTYKIRPIFFEFNKISLTEEAMTELDNLITIMKEHPESTVDLNGYTDSKGPKEINKIIAEQRANSVKQYMISKGIQHKRLNVYALGKTDFIAVNKDAQGKDLPSGRKYNRRVEIEFNNIGENVKIQNELPVPEHLKINN